MLDLFLFPPGARGDFLVSILFGDQLLADGKSATITNIGGRVTNIAKLHEFGQSPWADVFVTESDLSKYRTFIIDVSDPVDQQKVAWLFWRKKPISIKPPAKTSILRQEWYMPDGTIVYYDGTATYYQDGSFSNLDNPLRFGAVPGTSEYTYQEILNFLEVMTNDVKLWNSKYCKYYQNFDYVVPFKKLFDLEYISELYKKIHNTELPSDALERIRYNINLNNDIINQKSSIIPI